MKIMMIGSTEYREKMESLKAKLIREGHAVRIPAFDDTEELDAFGIWLHNRAMIRWCDEVCLVWNGRSPCTMFDLGMAFMAGRPVRIEYLEPKSFMNGLLQYAEEGADDRGI